MKSNYFGFYSLSLIMHLLLLAFGLTWFTPTNLGQGQTVETSMINTYSLAYPSNSRSQPQPSQPHPNTKKILVKKTTPIRKMPVSPSNHSPQKPMAGGGDKRASREASASELLRLLYLAIAKHQHYPEGEKATNLKIRVAFKVYPDGKITDIVLDKSSHHANFDLAALRSIADASPVKTLIGKLQQPKTFRIEIIFVNT